MVKLYDCETLCEVIDFLSVRLKIDRQFIRIEDGQVYVGSVHCKQLIVHGARRIDKYRGPLFWYTLYTTADVSKKKTSYL